MCKLTCVQELGVFWSSVGEEKAKNMAMHTRSAALRQEIESSLAARIPAALSPQAAQAPRLLPIANEAVNALLGGGLPIGGICEFTGAVTAGRTSLALSVLSEATVDSACAYIDVSDSLDGRSAAAAGVQLQNLLWVRFAEEQEPRAGQPLVYAVPARIIPDRLHGATQHGYGPHPRSETKGMGPALQKMLVQKAETRLRKMEGTPGYPNQRLSLASASQEQVSYDHFNARRADVSDPLRQLDRRAADDAAKSARERATVQSPVKIGLRHNEKPWSRLDKALRAADQILQMGGFRVVVLDLASIAPEQALRIPSATWYRFSRAAQEGDAILLLLTPEPCARSSAKCVLDCSPRTVARGSANLLNGFIHASEVIRQRVANPYAKKSPGRAVEWSATAPWMYGTGR